MASTRNDPELSLQGTFPRGGEVPPSSTKKPLTGKFALQAAKERELEEAYGSDLGGGSSLTVSDEQRLEGAANFRYIREQYLGLKSGHIAVISELETAEPEQVEMGQQSLPLE